MKGHGGHTAAGVDVEPTTNSEVSYSTLRKRHASQAQGSLGCMCRRRGCSSVARTSDRQAADAGSIPRYRKGFFSPDLTFSADSLSVSVHPYVQSRALTSVRTIKILFSMSEFGGSWQQKHTQHAL